MIPLIRPQFPEMRDIERHFSKSRKVGSFSNFGPCFFEAVKKLHEITGRYDLPCATGTAAIQVCAQITFKRGSRILIPDFTHIGTLNAILAAGCLPVLYEVSRDTWTLRNLFHNFKKEFDGFVVVSPFGYGVDFDFYDGLSDLIKKPVIYDLAGGWGMKVSTRNPVAYSLHATKNFSCGEGGIASFRSPGRFDDARALLSFDYGSTREPMSPWGNNLKPDELKCAIILAHLDNQERITHRAETKRQLINFYQTELENFCIPHSLHEQNAAPSMCVLGGMRAWEIEAISKYHEFESRKYYPLLTEFEGLKSIERIGTSSPFFRTCIALPSDVTRAEAEKVVRGIRKIYRGQDAKA